MFGHIFITRIVGIDPAAFFAGAAVPAQRVEFRVTVDALREFDDAPGGGFRHVRESWLVGRPA